MSIEFNCQVCRQRLSTPEGSAGRQCQCPACGRLLTIPSRSTVALGNAGNAPASTQHSAPSSKVQKPVIETSVGSLKIPCPRCRFELICSPSLLGTKGQCRNCQHIFTIVSSDSAWPTSSESDSPDLVFHCPSCAQLFAGQAEMEGKKGKCHACGEVFAIALEPAPVSAPSPTAKPSATKVVISSAQRQTPIQFKCLYCSGVMEVPASTSGQQTLCPYCGEPLTIPEVPNS